MCLYSVTFVFFLYLLFIQLFKLSRAGVLVSLMIYFILFLSIRDCSLELFLKLRFVFCWCFD